jgi:hypothetical protein
MASCGYSLLLQNADSCGISSEYPKHVVFVMLKGCDHLKFCKISGDKATDSKMKLLLARAGKIING